MNQLNVSLQHSILTLAAHGWSHRRIDLELGINRETVGKYLRLARSKPAISTPGSESDPAAKPAILTLGSEGDPDPKPAISTAGSGRQSSCLAWLPQVEGAVAVGCDHGAERALVLAGHNGAVRDYAWNVGVELCQQKCQQKCQQRRCE